VRAARRGFRRRLVETPGVVASVGDGEAVGASIYLRVHLTKMRPVTESHFANLRNMQLPDGWELNMGNEVWRHARELSLGFHYEWQPRPPEPWMNARREWGAFVRDILSRSRTLDSELQVAQAVTNGHLLDGGVLARWQAIRDTFTPNTVAVWHDDTVLELCAKWARKAPGIVWVEHAQFATRLAAETGLHFFGESGFTLDGQTYIEDAPRGSAIIASIRANKDGKNLQHKWCRNLVVSPPEGWDAWQQMIARTHRPGQTADAVEIDVLWGCAEHIQAWDRAIAGTHAARDTVGSDNIVPKLLLALPDAHLPTARELAALSGARWRA
jgi:hypothetical protein